VLEELEELVGRRRERRRVGGVVVEDMGGEVFEDLLVAFPLPLSLGMSWLWLPAFLQQSGKPPRAEQVVTTLGGNGPWYPAKMVGMLGAAVLETAISWGWMPGMVWV